MLLLQPSLLLLLLLPQPTMSLLLLLPQPPLLAVVAAVSATPDSPVPAACVPLLSELMPLLLLLVSAYGSSLLSSPIADYSRLEECGLSFIYF